MCVINTLEERTHFEVTQDTHTHTQEASGVLNEAVGPKRLNEKKRAALYVFILTGGSESGG